MLRKIYYLSKNYFYVSIAFPFSIFIWILILFIEPLIMIFVWKSIVAQGGILPMSLNEIVTYYLLSTVIYRIMQVWTMQNMGMRIYDGTLASWLLLPIHYLFIDLANNIGAKITRIILIVPVFIVCVMIFRENFVVFLSATDMIFLIISLLFGFLLQFFLENILGLIAFKFENIQGFVESYSMFLGFLSGGIIPLKMFPESIVGVLNFLPFRYLLSFPLEIILHNITYQEILLGFIVELIWMAIFYLLLKMLIPKLLKGYAPIGN